MLDLLPLLPLLKLTFIRQAAPAVENVKAFHLITDILVLPDEQYQPYT